MKNEIITTNKNTITTLEIAEMMETDHWQILRKLEGRTKKDGSHSKGYIEILSDNHLVVADYFQKTSYVDEQEKERPCYRVTKLGCDFLANKFTGEKGVLFTAKYVKRFDEMEQEIKEKYKLPTTYKEALVQLLEQVEANEQLMLENEEMKPKAEFHDAVSVAENCVSFGDFATAFQNNSKVSFGRNKIMKWCRDNNYLCSSANLKNKPTQQMIENGYMKYRENIDERNGKKYVTYTPLLTGKGQIWLTKKLTEYLNNK